MSNCLKTIDLNGRVFSLVGTAHVSQESIQEVKETISREKPACVAIELDEKRYQSIMEESSWHNLDIIAVLKRNEGFLLLANLVMASFQKRMGMSVGVKPGDEMKAGIVAARELNIPVAMVDRPIQLTLRRAWAKSSFMGKNKLLTLLIGSAFDKEKVSENEIENLKQSNEMDVMMNDLAQFLPTVKEVLIDERDRYLASHIWKCQGDSVLAVLGAGHLPGVERHLRLLAAGQENADTSDIECLPKKKIPSSIVGWGIAALIIALFVCGFLFGGKSVGSDMIGRWVFWNGTLAALGSLAGGAHVMTILAAFVGAPFTSLIPVVGVGMITGIVQAWICKPKVSDMESLQSDAGTIKGFYHNRILRVLLVFVLSTLGSSLGTFMAGASFIGAHVHLFG
ncbi:MAG: TraB/GumN family protein [Treponema sp.]|nr:TraB/GumN family protein [Treponema sp.]